MTDRMHIPQEDLALYSMRSLPGEAAEAVRMHLDACAQCRQDLAEVMAELGLLGLSTGQHPLPEGARQRFLERMASVSQNRHSQPEPAIPRERRWRGIAWWTPWLAAAALAIVAIALGVEVHSLRERLQRDSREVARLNAQTSLNERVLDVLTSPESKRVTLTPGETPAEPSGRAIYLASRGALVFQGSHLQALPESKTYELWIIPANGSAPVPAGLFRPDASGTATLVLPQIPRGIQAKAFGVTVERAGGSASPTLPILLSGAV